MSNSVHFAPRMSKITIYKINIETNGRERRPVMGNIVNVIIVIDGEYGVRERAVHFQRRKLRRSFIFQ